MNSIKKFIAQFESLSNEAFESLYGCLRPEAFEKGDFLIREQQYSNHLYFLQEGSARAFFHKDGKEVTTWFAFENQMLTSFYSFISRTPSIENIQFLEKSTLFSIHHEKLQKLYQEYHEIERLGRKITEFYYQWQEERIFSLQFHSAKERYQKLIANEPHLLQKVSLGHIASYLGITQETLSRIRKM